MSICKECYSGEHTRDWPCISNHYHSFYPTLIVTIIKNSICTWSQEQSQVCC